MPFFLEQVALMEQGSEIQIGQGQVSEYQKGVCPLDCVID